MPTPTSFRLSPVRLSPIRLGTAFGIAGALFYVACMIFMAFAPPDFVVWLSNSLLHGVDINSVMRESVPMQQAMVGVACTFVGGFLFGAITGLAYNAGLNDGTRNDAAK